MKDKYKSMTSGELLQLMRATEKADLTLTGILDALVRQLGGVDEFARPLALDYKRAEPGSVTRQMLRAIIVNLNVAHARLVENERQDVSLLTDEDIDRELSEILEKFHADRQGGQAT